MFIVDGSGPFDDEFEKLYRKHYARVWRYFRTNSVSDDESHDLTQDAFKRLYERMGKIRSDDRWGFLQSIAKTILLNRVRARQTQKRNATVIPIDDPELFNAEPAAAEERDYADRQAEEVRVEKLRTTVLSLPAGQRDCLRLWLDDLKYNEIAKTLGITLDAVRSRLRDAKRYLREQLGEEP
jgi:RNA polymerase sigma-70 factor (ECF subfamily)